MRQLALVMAFVALVAAGCAKSASEAAPDGAARVQADLDELVRSGITGAIATTTVAGHTTTLSAGVANQVTGEPIPTDPPQRVRVGSVGKSFIATIVLQLVGEGRIRLDEPIDTYLPGLLTGDGVDGRVITVRQILQHRSGLPEFSDEAEVDEVAAAAAGRVFTPDEEIRLALRRPAQFAPGARQKYTNTNYVVLTELIRTCTGNPYAAELERRIIAPLGLADTYLPPAGEHDIRGPHPHGYAIIDGARTDVTRIEPSVPGAAGGLVSTGADLNRFFTALIAGELLRRPEMDAMPASLPMSEPYPLDYGLGLMTTDLPCGTKFLGHTGGITGYITLSGATPQGRAATITITESADIESRADTLLAHALCP
ncbi:serine hydrolase domain-containing protein [Nocardia brasiliensis]|uniref:serine hydrolase domain-containing protein n=1 Tax=Nocardia brasiliensis TaxID=37326 RepID=UPI0024541A3F|nr:serine hydrolase domain-containing protein [Nocardia brasiliensis]